MRGFLGCRLIRLLANIKVTMETIYDYNITKEEEIILFGIEVRREIVESTIETQRNWDNLLYRLFKIRGDDEMAHKIALRIPNDEHKIFELCNIDH